MMQRGGHIFCRAPQFRLRRFVGLFKAKTWYGRLDTAISL